jgi:hypothetical protein
MLIKDSKRRNGSSKRVSMPFYETNSSSIKVLAKKKKKVKERKKESNVRSVSLKV